MKKVMAPLERKYKTLMLSMTLGQFAPPKINIYIYIFSKTNNDHGVDVSMIIVIQLKHIENNGIKNHSHQVHL
jgi:hypothetical protein